VNALLVMVTMMAAPTDAHVDRTVSVTGDAEVRVVPDQAQLWLAVETVDKTIAKAKAANDERVKKTLETLKKLGLPDKDVATDYLTVEARYDNGSYSRSASNEPDGYAVKKSVVVTLRDLKRFEETVQAVLGAGTNRIEGQEFRTSELRKHRDAARALALKAAHEKATAMAAELGAKAGKVRSISEYGGGYSYGWRGRYGGGGMAQNVSQNIGGGGDDGASDQGFAPGLISVRTQVQVVFDLE
jgi:uncharacterized protein YggE